MNSPSAHRLREAGVRATTETMRIRSDLQFKSGPHNYVGAQDSPADSGPQDVLPEWPSKITAASSNSSRSM
jgi:hypothetical protein